MSSALSSVRFPASTSPSSSASSSPGSQRSLSHLVPGKNSIESPNARLLLISELGTKDQTKLIIDYFSKNGLSDLAGLMRLYPGYIDRFAMENHQFKLITDEGESEGSELVKSTAQSVEQKVQLYYSALSIIINNKPNIQADELKLALEKLKELVSSIPLEKAGGEDSLIRAFAPVLAIFAQNDKLILGKLKKLISLIPFKEVRDIGSLVKAFAPVLALFAQDGGLTDEMGKMWNDPTFFKEFRMSKNDPMRFALLEGRTSSLKHFAKNLCKTTEMEIGVKKFPVTEQFERNATSFSQVEFIEDAGQSEVWNPKNNSVEDLLAKIDHFAKGLPDYAKFMFQDIIPGEAMTVWIRALNAIHCLKPDKNSHISFFTGIYGNDRPVSIERDENHLQVTYSTDFTLTYSNSKSDDDMFTLKIPIEVRWNFSYNDKDKCWNDSKAPRYILFPDKNSAVVAVNDFRGGASEEKKDG